MRKLWIVGVVAASLGLAACGTTVTLNAAIASVGASADLQVHLTGSVTGPDSTEAQQVLGALSVDLNYSSPSGSPLDQSEATANAEVIVNAGGDALLDVRDVDSNVYVTLDVNAIANIPDATLSAAQLSALQLLVGGRWFELPASVINSYVPKSDAAEATAAKERAIATTIIDDLTTLISGTTYTTLSGGGLSQTGSLESVVKAVWPTIATLEPGSAMPSDVPGSYTISVTTSGSTATGGSISITAPNGTSGTDSVALTATVAHASDDVVAPSDATIITPALLKGLLAHAT